MGQDRVGWERGGPGHDVRVEWKHNRDIRELSFWGLSRQACGCADLRCRGTAGGQRWIGAQRGPSGTTPARLTASADWGTQRAELRIGAEDGLEEEVPGSPAPLI